MSSLWTPEGEHRVPRQPSPSESPPSGAAPPQGAPGGPPGPGRPPGPGAPTGAAHRPGPGGEADDAELLEHLEELRNQLVATPVEVVIANHAYGLFELAAIHLSERQADVEQARLAIDALGALVEGLAGRLGEPEVSLVDALAQIRLAFVQISAAQGPEASAVPGGGSGPVTARG